MNDDEMIAAMVQEAAELGPMTAAEFQEATLAIRAYASLARAQKEGDLISVGGPIGGLAEEGA